MTDYRLPDIEVPADMRPEEMPDLLRYWYLGTRARRHMALRRFAEVDRELNGVEGLRVLDIGSAWGYNVMALGRMGAEVCGMDIVTEQFAAGSRIAHSNGIAFNVLGGDAARLPFPKNHFDGITMVETFEHVFKADRSVVIRECHRVLKPGGRIVLSTPNSHSLVETAKRGIVRLPWLRRRLPAMMYPSESVGREEYHPYRYHYPLSPSGIRNLLSENGFRIKKTKFFLFVLKSTPNGVYPLQRLLERAGERTPLVNRLAATVCVVADKA